jgi:hypothetical protein
MIAGIAKPQNSAIPQAGFRWGFLHGHFAGAASTRGRAGIAHTD